MASIQDQLSKLVFSTELGQICSGCQQEIAKCQCEELQEQERLANLNGPVKIRLETSGRKGKGVTTLTGIPLNKQELSQLTQQLKKRCGSGGAVKDYVIEIQGDHRDLLLQELLKQGFRARIV